MRRDAIKVIQRCYHAYRMRTLIPKALLYRKFNGAQTIQKYLRGYSVARRTKIMHAKFRLQKHFAYFEQMRFQLMVKAHLLIKRQWDLFIKRKRSKEEEAARVINDARIAAELEAKLMLELDDDYGQETKKPTKSKKKVVGNKPSSNQLKSSNSKAPSSTFKKSAKKQVINKALAESPSI